MTEWYLGQKIVCINTGKLYGVYPEPDFGTSRNIELNQVYEIALIRDDLGEDLRVILKGFHLYEKRSFLSRKILSNGYFIDRFVPLDKNLESIQEFEKFL
jgi:hypothetical protein